LWLRVSVSEVPAPLGESDGNPDGRGPTGGYEYGETEDYLLFEQDPGMYLPYE
jgi:hypothetical protein